MDVDVEEEDEDLVVDVLLAVEVVVLLVDQCQGHGTPCPYELYDFR